MPSQAAETENEKILLFQILDPKQECYKIYCNQQLVEDYISDTLTHTWSPVLHLQEKDIEYAQIWCEGQNINDVCPDSLRPRWESVNARALTFLKTFKNAKINLDDVCFYDMLPEKFLLDFYELKNEITQHVFKTYKKPANYEFLKDLMFFLKQIKNNKLNVDLSNANFSNDKVRNSMAKVRSCPTQIIYNPWKTVTGRLTTEKESFPILTLNKELRSIIKPKNDVFVELDFNAAEIRVLLALLGEEQPQEDIHSWISKNIFENQFDREKTKKKVFSWLYNPKAKNKKLNDFLNRDKIYQKYFVNDCVSTPYGRVIPVGKEKAVNYLVQSTSSDMLLNSAISVSKKLRYKKSFVAFCIHDSIVLDMSSEERNMIKDLYETFATTKFGQVRANLSMGRDFGSMSKVL